MKCCMSEMFEKEIISLRDGSCLGTASDFEFDMSCGRLEAVIVTLRRGGISFSKKAEKLRIAYEKIQVIGEDTILVDCDLPARESAEQKSGLLSAIFRDG